VHSANPILAAECCFNAIEFCTGLSLYLSISVVPIMPVVEDKRTKGPKTPSAPDLTNFQKEAIFGSMLGDLTAERSNITGNTRLRFYMSSINKELIYHLYSIFNPYVKTGPKLINRKLNKLTKLEHTDISFSTLKYALFNWVFEDFYIKSENKNIKIVPKNSINRITPVSLAYWIMDDGSFSKSKGYLILCTDSYCKEDVLYLISILKTKFNLSSALVKISRPTVLENNTKIYYRIRINKSSLPILIELVKPYFIPSMLYKLGL
jgi:hypothetical protein